MCTRSFIMRRFHHRIAWTCLLLILTTIVVYRLKFSGQRKFEEVPQIHEVPRLAFDSAASSVNAKAQVFVPVESDCKFRSKIKVPGLNDTYPFCTYDPDMDRWVSLFITKYQFWERELVMTMLDVMNLHAGQITSEADNNNTISLVDLGCHIGVFTMSAALSGYEVLAVDAMNSSLQLLATSLRLAGPRSRVTMLHNAISSKRGSVLVKVEVGNIGGSRVARTKFGMANNTAVVNTQAIVAAICMDDLLPYVPSKRVFVKMDIEMSEWLALKCADQFFTQLEVPYVMMEWMWYKYHTKSGLSVVEDMTRLGYRAYLVEAQKGDPLPLNNRTNWPDNVLWRKEPSK